MLGSAIFLGGSVTVADAPIHLKTLLRQRHWQRYQTFCREYDKAAQTMDKELLGTWPSRAQLHRWISGQLTRLPYPHHCQVLEAMFPGWSAEQLFASGAPGLPPESGAFQHGPLSGRPPTDRGRMGDIAAVFTSRFDFTAQVPPQQLLDGATEILAAGLSLNVLCQQYSDRRLRAALEGGATVKCLFLDPGGEAITAREKEEGHSVGELSALTSHNMTVLQRLRSNLEPVVSERLELATYDETIRFNILLVDGRKGVVQPYLPDARGSEAPTLLLERDESGPGLLNVFAEVFEGLWARGKPI